jgi:hypothetical protein
MQTAIDNFAVVKPARLGCTSGSSNCKYPASIRRALARKRCYWHKCKELHENFEVTLAYRGAERKSRALIRNFEIRKEQKIIGSNNVGAFYRFISID